MLENQRQLIFQLMLSFAKALSKGYKSIINRNYPSLSGKSIIGIKNHNYFMSLSCRMNFFCTSKTSFRNSQQTFELLVDYMKEKVNYATQLEQILIDETNKVNSSVNKEQTRIQLSQLAPIVELYQQIAAHQQNLRYIHQLLSQTKDKEEKEFLNEEVISVNAQLQELREQSWELLIPPAPYQKVDDIILEFRPGAGGMESSIFVQDISEMYESFASTQGWRCNISNSSKESGVSRGYKMLDLRVQGPGCHKTFKCQAGVHKVIRIPETQSKGRLHSSTISMVVMPVVPFTFELDLKDIKYQFTRSSGPGGQSVNKIQSACRATHIPTGLAVFIQEEKSQDTNKRRATQILKQRLFEMEYKKAMDEEQFKRKSQVTTMDRSEKIRTYNYPQDRITDHRTGLTRFGIKEMMNGQMLQEFIEAYSQNVEEQKIEAMIHELYQKAGLTVPK